MTRPPTPKSAKVRKIKVWVPTDKNGAPIKACGRVFVYESKAAFKRNWHGLEPTPATLLLPAKGKGKA